MGFALSRYFILCITHDRFRACCWQYLRTTYHRSSWVPSHRSCLFDICNSPLQRKPHIKTSKCRNQPLPVRWNLRTALFNSLVPRQHACLHIIVFVFNKNLHVRETSEIFLCLHTDVWASFHRIFRIFSMVIKYFLVILLITSFKLITEASETSHLTTLIFSNQTSQTTAVGLKILCILLCSDGC